MKPPPFAYADPRSLPAALRLLAEHGEEGKVLAGGQSLVPLLNLRLAQPAALIDLNRVPELQYARWEARDGRDGYAIGAMTRQRTVERDPAAPSLLRAALALVGHPQIRNRGTIGGSIAHADPAAELPLVFLALGGQATARSVFGERIIGADEFFAYTFTTALAPDELLTEVWFPSWPVRTGTAILEVARRHGDFALVAAAAVVTLDGGGRCADARLALGGVAPTPIRTMRIEEAVMGETLTDETIERAAARAGEDLDPPADMHADAEYRREVAMTLAARALRLARDRAGQETA